MLGKSGTTSSTTEFNTHSMFPKGRALHIAVKNTHGSNAGTLKIEGYVTEGNENSVKELLAAEDILAEAIKLLEVPASPVYEEVKVSIKTKTGTDHITYEVHEVMRNE